MVERMKGSSSAGAATGVASARAPHTVPGSSVPDPRAGEGTAFTLGHGVRCAAHARPYEHRSGDPVYRPLRIFTQDPSTPRRDGSIATVNVPYEPLAPGPESAIFQIDNYDGWQQLHYRQVNLDDPSVLIRDGREPSVSDPQFHQQMVYAVCSLVYAAFRRALGRHVAWGFGNGEAGPDHQLRLRVRPHAANEENAYYDKASGELCFGYFRAKLQVAGLNLPGGFVFTCLSHDIVAHEVTHALLDGLRAHFAFPSGPDIVAFHEGFADLVAIFQHFSYEQVLQSAIRQTQGQLERARLLTDLGRQFGETSGQMKALRSAIGETDAPRPYDSTKEPHALGAVLVSAVFEAFTTIFKRRTERYLRLATNGTGVLPPGEMHPDLRDLLAAEASKIAKQFLSICIRAIDYCPPVDLEFGEFLRAVITADYDLVPDDPWHYREAWISAFQRRHLYPQHVTTLSEDALLWRPARKPIPDIAELSFASLQFDGDPGRPASAEELRRQACALGRVVTHPECLQAFGLAPPGEARLGKDTVDLPRVESIRSSRRVGPDGEILFDLVAEVTQRRVVRGPQGNEEFDFYGGATVILGPRGEIRYVISKSVLNEARLERQREYARSKFGSQFWQVTQGKQVPKAQLFKLLDG
jgi:hypothetical protein